jgi:hypothetical protein
MRFRITKSTDIRDPRVPCGVRRIFVTPGKELTINVPDNYLPPDGWEPMDERAQAAIVRKSEERQERLLHILTRQPESVVPEAYRAKTPDQVPIYKPPLATDEISPGVPPGIPKPIAGREA